MIDMACLEPQRQRIKGASHVVAVSIPEASGHRTHPQKRQRQVSGGVEHVDEAGSLELPGEQMTASECQRKDQLESPVVPFTPTGRRGKRALLSPLPTPPTDMEVETASSAACLANNGVSPKEKQGVQRKAPPKPYTPTGMEIDAATSSLTKTTLTNPMTPPTPHTSFRPSVPPSTPGGASASLLPSQEFSTTAISLILCLFRNATVYAYDAGWYDSCRPITRPRGTREVRTFLLPIHRAGHWNLAELEPERKVVKCFDSLGKMDKDLMAGLKRDLEPFDGQGGANGQVGQWCVEARMTPRQSNAVDCGDLSWLSRCV